MEVLFVFILFSILLICCIICFRKTTLQVQEKPQTEMANEKEEVSNEEGEQPEVPNPEESQPFLSPNAVNRNKNNTSKMRRVEILKFTGNIFW